jgi:hypothetical protein
VGEKELWDIVDKRGMWCGQAEVGCRKQETSRPDSKYQEGDISSYQWQDIVIIVNCSFHR